jgi:hypothetical protein
MSNELVQTVTGRLERIDFGARMLTIIYAVTRRELDCHYDESIEELLLENPRELIQVTGRVTLDEEGNPTRITDVEDIREVDLSPFHLSEFRLPDRTLRLREPLLLTPALDETEQLLCLSDPTLGIDICAPTREELDVALHEEIDVLWRNYALADTVQPMTDAAASLKQRLVEAIEERHAA